MAPRPVRKFVGLLDGWHDWCMPIVPCAYATTSLVRSLGFVGMRTSPHEACTCFSSTPAVAYSTRNMRAPCSRAGSTLSSLYLSSCPGFLPLRLGSDVQGALPLLILAPPASTEVGAACAGVAEAGAPP